MTTLNKNNFKKGVIFFFRDGAPYLVLGKYKDKVRLLELSTLKLYVDYYSRLLDNSYTHVVGDSKDLSEILREVYNIPKEV